MTSDQPRAAPRNRPTKTRTPLNAVFRRLSGTPAAVAPGVAPRQPEPPPRPVSRPGPPPVATEPKDSAQDGRSEVPPPAQPEPAPPGQPPGPGSVAEALRRSVAEGALARQVQGAATVPVRPLPHSPGEIRPPPPQPRAEDPPGPSQAAFRPDAAPGIERIGAAGTAASSRAVARPAGFPATNVPSVMVEPQTERERALAQPAGDRPTLGNRRLYRRIGIEAELAIDGVKSPLVDLSLGGFAAASVPLLQPNAVVPVSVRVSVDGIEFGTMLRARMVYTDAPRSLGYSNDSRSPGFSNEPRSGGRFIDLTASQTAFLRYVVTRRGRSVGALGATMLLAALPRWPEHSRPAPVPQPDDPPEELPGEPGRRTPWWPRWFGRLSGSRREAK